MKIIEDEYIKIKAMLAKMSETASSMLKDSVSSYTNNDIELANTVIKNDSIVDKCDNDIEEACIKMLAIYNPRAFDLRFIISALRVIIDLERIGDSCVNIAKQTKISDFSMMDRFRSKLDQMTNEAYNMVDLSINAFFNNDINTALSTIKMDNRIDELNNQIITDIIDFISKKPKKVKDGVSLIYVVRNIERIADHSTNICEFVYFKETGKSIKHTYFDSVKEIKNNG
jgi:phosphate transport system protein